MSSEATNHSVTVLASSEQKEAMDQWLGQLPTGQMVKFIPSSEKDRKCAEHICERHSPSKLRTVLKWGVPVTVLFTSWAAYSAFQEMYPQIVATYEFTNAAQKCFVNETSVNLDCLKTALDQFTAPPLPYNPLQLGDGREHAPGLWDLTQWGTGMTYKAVRWLAPGACNTAETIVGTISDGVSGIVTYGMPTAGVTVGALKFSPFKWLTYTALTTYGLFLSMRLYI
ncbi:MAG: hypothetical protein S4CHLAM123_08310 [Chlamydiales bacterium]|nr:hypothetical protein [Chlamydiales bacterium]